MVYFTLLADNACTGGFWIFRRLSAYFVKKRQFFVACDGKWCEWSFLCGVYFYNLTFDMNLYMEKLLNRKFESYSRYEYNS